MEAAETDVFRLQIQHVENKILELLETYGKLSFSVLCL